MVDALVMVQVEVQFDAWLMHGTSCLVHFDWYRFTVVYLTVIV